MKISVIVSTYNRSKDLTRMIESLLSLKIDDSFDHEIIIVDNNSNDNTKEIVESFISKNHKIQYVFEPRQGLSIARNTAVRIAKGEILAFTDDDVEIDKNWLSNIAYFSLIQDFDALGGIVLPTYPDNTPQWIKDCRDILSGPIVSHDYGKTIQLYNSKMVPFVGANMIIKRKIFEEIGYFNIALGAGTGSIGEDTEYFRRLLKFNKKIFYNPNVIIFHPVKKTRINLNYFAKWNITYGKYLVFKNSIEKENLIYVFGIPRYLFRSIVNFSWIMIKSIRNKHQFIKAWCELFRSIGMIFAYHSRNIKADCVKRN